MFVGLLITFATGYFVSTNIDMLINVINLYWLLVIVEFALVIFLSWRIHKMSVTTARISFMLYSFVSGLTFASIFVVFEISSIMYAFLISALLFGIFAVIGYVTKMDLTKISTYLFMGLIGIIICSIVNIFLGNNTFDIVLNIITVIVFVGFTAYDIQKIKRMTNSDNEDAIAIIGALELYLDFINIFLSILNLSGNRD